MIPAELPDEDIRHRLDGDLTVALLFPITVMQLVYTAAEYAHRFGHAHRATPQIGRYARLWRREREWNIFDARDYDVAALIAQWRASGVTWTRRRPPRFIPPQDVVHAPRLGMEYKWENVGHETYVYRYRVHAHRRDGVILWDLSRSACVCPTWDKLEAFYIPIGKVRRVYRFGGTDLFSL